MEGSLEKTRREIEGLLAEKENLEAIFNSVTDGILAHDTEMTITNFNRAAEQITGFSRKEALGKKCMDIFEIKLCGEDCALCQSFDNKAGLKEREVRIRRKDGEYRQILLNTAVLRDREGLVRGAVSVLRDITEITSLRQELKGRYSSEHLPPEILQKKNGESFRPTVGEKAGPQAILKALEETRWNRTQAARYLGVDRTTLWHKMKEYRIQPPR